jgi:hypothetical protein
MMAARNTRPDSFEISHPQYDPMFTQFVSETRDTPVHKAVIPVVDRLIPRREATPKEYRWALRPPKKEFSFLFVPCFPLLVWRREFGRDTVSVAYLLGTLLPSSRLLWKKGFSAGLFFLSCRLGLH